jgi:hypothetical protein
MKKPLWITGLIMLVLFTVTAAQRLKRQLPWPQR